MARITKTYVIYPMMKGLDKETIPGSQDPRSLKSCKNNIINARGSLKKAPGVRRIPYIGKEGGIQAAIHFFATTGAGQASEIVRVRQGRVEIIRNESVVDMGIQVSETDTIVFERFQNALIIHFENTAPVYYTIGASALINLGIFTSHQASPPSFSRVHDFRLWYGGRGAAPHSLVVSAINDIQDYSLLGGGFLMSIDSGDGDPKGLTGISPTFKGDLYAFKWNSIHRIVRRDYGYSREKVSDEVGCVHHNTIISTQTDMFFVSPFAIHSLVSSDKYGSIEEASLTFPIYSYFQDNVNWSLAKNMIATYDKPSNSYLLSYASGGSSVNDRVLGFNVKSKEFFEWNDIEYPAIGKYFDAGRQKTLIGDNANGMGVLDSEYNTRFDQAIDFQARTGIIYPLINPKMVVNFTKAWVIAKPTSDDVNFTLNYFINGDLRDSIEFNTYGEGVSFDGTQSKTVSQIQVGTSVIGDAHKDSIILEAELAGEGNAIEFEIIQEPDENDPDQSLEIYGIVFEYSYFEDQDTTAKI